MSYSVFIKTSVEDSDSIIHENYFPEDYIGYRYPILPGTTEWRKFENHQQMVDACQIPDDVYQNMTTEELAQTILAYPLNADMFAYESFEMGFSVVKEHFDGLQDFCDRTDNVSYLIDLYSRQELVQRSNLDEATLQAFESDNPIITTDIGKKACKQIFNNLTLSLFLSQDEFLEKMTLLDELNLNNIIYDRNAIMNEALEESESETGGPPRGATPCEFVRLPKPSEGGHINQTGSTTVQTPKGGSMTGYIFDAREVWSYSDGIDRIRELSDLSSGAKAA